MDDLVARLCCYFLGLVIGFLIGMVAIKEFRK